ncbi:MAG: hypothetical protein R8K49_02775 [Mariprofundaceae bacterium]
MDDVLLNKAAIIERCLKRMQEEYIGYEGELAYQAGCYCVEYTASM